MNGVFQDSVSLGQKIITGKIFLFICIAIICIGIALYQFSRPKAKYNRIWGVVQKSQCHISGDGKYIKTVCRLKVSYHINQQLQVKYFEYDGKNNYFEGQPIELEYQGNNYDDIHICCSLSHKKLGFLFLVGAMVCLCIAFIDYYLRGNRAFAAYETFDFFS